MEVAGYVFAPAHRTGCPVRSCCWSAIVRRWHIYGCQLHFPQCDHHTTSAAHAISNRHGLSQDFGFFFLKKKKLASRSALAGPPGKQRTRTRHKKDCEKDKDKELVEPPHQLSPTYLSDTTAPSRVVPLLLPSAASPSISLTGCPSP